MFQLEKEMIPILRRELPKIFGSTHAAEEFVSGNGRPDLVFARALNIQDVDTSSLASYEIIHLLVKYLNKEGKILHIDEFLTFGIGNRKKVRTILDNLHTLGFVGYKDKNYIVVLKKYRPASENFVSIEAKLTDWKGGTYQAIRYKTFSNSAYLAIAADYLDRVDKSFLKANGVGLISVASNSIELILKAKKNKPISLISNYYLTERLLNLADIAS